MDRDPLYTALHTALCAEYGCALPVAGLTTEREVAAAISRGGGIGVLAPLPEHGPERIEEDVRWLKRQADDRPWGVDLVVPASYVEGSAEALAARIPEGHRRFVAELQARFAIPEPRTPDRLGVARLNLVQRAADKLEVVLQERAPILALGLGSPAPMIERAHAEGTRVWSLVGSTRQARRAVEAGADMVVATGMDAAAHSGNTGTFSLVAEVAEAVGSGRVLAAGGVTTGRQLVAALALGAVGVWTGTIWQATAESNVDLYLKQRLIEAESPEVVRTRSRTGKPFHQLRSSWTDAWDEPGAPEPLEMPLQQMLVGRVQQAFEDWRIEPLMSVPAGQGVAGIHSIRTVQQVLDDLGAEARATLAALIAGAATVATERSS